MSLFKKNIFKVSAAVGLSAAVWVTTAQITGFNYFGSSYNQDNKQLDSAEIAAAILESTDQEEKSYLDELYVSPFNEVMIDSPVTTPIPSPVDPNENGYKPINVEEEVIYDPETNTYLFQETVGGQFNYRSPSEMSLEEYRNYDMQKYLNNNWNELTNSETSKDQGLLPPIDLGGEKLEDVFGKGGIDIRPSGNAELSFGITSNRTDNPVIPEKNRRITTFDFQEKIQLNVIGTVGDKLKLSFNYNTEATFDFENQLKLEYKGHEDEIIQSIEAGNVTLPLSGSLITGSQSLFGIKSELRFGRLYVTSVFSQQKGQKSEVTVAGGAQVQNYEVKADNYEANKHYFLSQYFRNSYDDALKSLPYVNSNANITKIEVWITNTNNTTTNTRNIIALTDLGENTDLQDPVNTILVNSNPDNDHNVQYSNVGSNSAIRSFVSATNALTGLGYKAATDFEKIENSRMLTPQEFTYNAKLGYISLNQSLNNDEVLAVAYQYTLGDSTYQVGEFSTDGVAGNNALMLKLLKPTLTNTKTKLWDLMMKNIYSIGAYQVSPEDFQLQIYYNNPATSVQIPFLPYGGLNESPIIQVLDLDRINQNGSAYPDGFFDFVPVNTAGNISSTGGTINPRNGRVIFTTIEPFGNTLLNKLNANNVANADQIAFTELYDSTKAYAQNNLAKKNRFYIKGSYKSSVSSEISLNALNIPQGAVQVTAGGRILQENVHYTVDYNLGRVKIIDDGLLSSQTPIKVSTESNSLFNIQQKTMLGTHFDYRINKDANIGATILRMSEKPLTQKINYGDEPTRNTQLGLNGNFRKDIPLLTKWIDKIPFIETKEKSTITFAAEAAALIPGHARAIGKSGTAYIDDFEGSQSAIDIRSFSQWKLASTPKGQPDLFPEGELNDDLASGYNRAKLAWYVIDPLFFRNNNLTPDHIKDNPVIQDDNRMREVLLAEVFPNLNVPAGTPQNIAVFDVSYYPNEKGPYNYDTQGSPAANSAGLETDGSLKDPESRWAGIMRALNTNDFETANIEFIQFWVMDPYTADGDPNGTHQGGDLYFNLGNVSEDILPDSRKAFEHGIPIDGSATLDATNWGNVPTTQVIVNTFDNDVNTRAAQDVGLDLLSDAQEQAKFNDYINYANNNLTPAAAAQISADPSNDNYNYFRDDVYDNQQLDILNRYKRYNNHQGNSPTSEMSDTANADGYVTSASTIPDIEDINNDNNLSESESYFQYKISMRKSDLVVGKGYVTDKVDGNNGATWYQFKVPVKQPNKVINGIQDFRSIRFMRMFLKEFEDPVTLRFARLELIRGEWRRYEEDLLTDGEIIPTDPDNTVFNIGAVNTEQNAERVPIKYLLPAGIEYEKDITDPNLRNLNEQSLTLEVCGLEDGDARACYKNIDFDVRQYKRLKMFVHGERQNNADIVGDQDVTLFIRLGTDFSENYYEYEMPVKMSTWNNSDEGNVWPDENDIDIAFDDLKNAKLARNTSGANIAEVYSTAVPGSANKLIKVKGNPNLQGLKTIMIGVRNPKQAQDNPWKPDDGQDKCVEIWVNELRLTDFNQSGGWAATSRVSVKGADFMTLDLAGQISTPGWGSIESKPSTRSRETMRQFDASSSFELGKFFNEKWNLRIPMFLGYSVTSIDPQFDPLSPDILWSELDVAEQKSRAKQVRNYTQMRSINFTNVSKMRAQGKKAHFWDVENWSATYSYNEIFRRDVNTEYNMNKNYRGGLSYAFSANPKPWTPFKNVGLFKKSKWFDLIKDFNLYLAPKQIAIRNDIIRSYNENKIRSNADQLGFSNFTLPPQVTKQFNWNRNYDLKYDLTKNLKFNFSAINNARIQEPDSTINNPISKEFTPVDYEEWRDTVRKSIREFGQTMNYGHNMNLNYTWPINKIPLLDWVNLSTRYSTTYDWMRAPLAQDSLGHTIQNSRTVNWTAQLNMNTLYNKIPYFKKVNQKFQRGRRPSRATPSRKTTKPEEKKEGEEEDKKKKKVKDKNKVTILDHSIRFIMMLKTVSMNYSTTDGILLPGVHNSRESYILGMDNQFSSPGWDFISGAQNRNLMGIETRNYAFEAASKGWLVDSTDLVNQYTVNHQSNLSGRATIEPLVGFRIELSMDRNNSLNSTTNFRTEDDSFIEQQFVENGMLGFSTISWRTAFMNPDKTTYDYTPFNNLRDNRAEVSELVAKQRDSNAQLADTSIYHEQYGETQQEVVMGAFISAYTGRAVTEKSANPFKNIPLPNWRISYDIAKIKWLKKYVSKLNVSHGYRSNFTLANYQTNLEAGNLDLNNNFISQNQYNTAVLTEQFSPLIGFDATWKLKKNQKGRDGLITKMEIKKDRNISLSLANNQITEIFGSELVIGSGYKFDDVKFPFKIGGKEITSALKLRADISIRNNKTFTRQIVDGQTQPTAGQRIISIKSSAEYQLNKALMLRFYFDRVVNNPFISTSFPTANTNAGLALRFTLAQ